MSEQTFRKSPLGQPDPPPRGDDDAVVRLEERPGLGKLILRGDAKDNGFRSAVEGALGAPPPPPGRAATTDTATLLWQGPDSWLAVAALEETPRLAAALRTALVDRHFAVTDVSSGISVVGIAGPRARDLLYKGCFLDLAPPAFTTGQCAATRIAAFAIAIHQIDDWPAYDLYVARSMVQAFREWLLDAGLEYGLGRATN